MQIQINDKNLPVIRKYVDAENKIPQLNISTIYVEKPVQKKKVFLTQPKEKKPEQKAVEPKQEEKPIAKKVEVPKKTEDEFDPELLASMNASSTLHDLMQATRDAKTDLDLYTRPPLTGRDSVDKEILEKIDYFVETGVYMHANRIANLIEGLIKFANFDEDVFNTESKKLKIVLDNYKTLLDKVNKGFGRDSANYLDKLVTCAKTVISAEQEFKEIEIMEPNVGGSGIIQEEKPFDSLTQQTGDD